MSISSGTAGYSRVGSDHIGRVTKFTVVKFNVVSSSLLEQILSGNVQLPIFRFYVKDRTTLEETEITNAVTFASVRFHKKDSMASWSATLKPEKISSTFTDLWLTDLAADFSKFVIIKAGYLWNGSEVLSNVITGVKMDRQPSYGATSSSIVLNGFDLGQLLAGVDGVFSGYNSAQSLMTFILNKAGITAVDFSGFTDFDITGVEFNQNTAVDVFNRLSSSVGEFTWYFDGSGTFIARDLIQSGTSKYTIPNGSIFTPTSTVRDKVTEVVVTGNGVALTRRTNAADQAKYGGIRRVNLQNSIITSDAEAITAADQIINESRRDPMAITTSYNPFLFTDDIVTVNSQENGGDREYIIDGGTHTFQATDNTISSRTRYSAKSVDYDAPVIVTV